MKIALFSLMMNIPNAITGETLTDQQKFQNVLKQAELVEQLGFDAYGIGERHGEPFLSSTPPVVLTAIAARTSRIRLLSTVTVLSVLDPVRVAEDYATLDHLSGGRLELMIGLIDHYRERWAYYGRDPDDAIVGSGAGSLFLANTKEEAIERFRPYYQAFSQTEAAQHNRSPFHSLEDAVENGPALIGSAESVIEKILKYHQAFGHQALAIGVDGLTEAEQREQLERFASDVLPVLKREIPSKVWN